MSIYVCICIYTHLIYREHILPVRYTISNILTPFDTGERRDIYYYSVCVCVCTYVCLSVYMLIIITT
jgi:hypothetical protein